MLYNIITSHPSIYETYLVGQDTSVADLSSLSLTMVEAGARPQRQQQLMPRINEGLVLINMATITLPM